MHDKFSSCCPTPPPSTPNTLLLTTALRHSASGMQFGHLAKSSLQKGYEPKSCIDVSSGHTPINYTSRRNSFDVEPTVAASENSDFLHQEAAASGNPQPVQASVVIPWLGADMWSSIGQQVRGNASNASVEGTLSRRRRDRALEGVQT